jgi:hypothetical protein
MSVRVASEPSKAPLNGQVLQIFSKCRSNDLGIAGAKLLFWNPRKSLFDVLPTTGPGYFSAG